MSAETDRTREMYRPALSDEGLNPTRPVDLVVRINRFKQCIDCRLINLNPWQAGVIKFVQCATEDSSLSATAGHCAFGDLFMEVNNTVTVARQYINRLTVPVDTNLGDLVDIVYQPLVA